MRRTRALLSLAGRVLLVTGALLPAALGVAAATAQGQPAALTYQLVVTLDKSEVSGLTGHSFTFTSTITNKGSETSPALIANLNFVRLDNSTFVDPEDWSHDRTVPIDPIAAGETVTQDWTVNPVVKGEVAGFVVVLPASPNLATASSLISSPAIHAHVDEERTLNPGGVLPIVLAVPALIAVAFVGTRLRRSRE